MRLREEQEVGAPKDALKVMKLDQVASRVMSKEPLRIPGGAPKVARIGAALRRQPRWRRPSEGRRWQRFPREEA